MISVPLKVLAVPRELLCIIKVLVALLSVKAPLLVRVLPMVKVEVAVVPVKFKVPEALIVVVPVTFRLRLFVSKLVAFVPSPMIRLPPTVRSLVERLAEAPLAALDMVTLLKLLPPELMVTPEPVNVTVDEPAVKAPVPVIAKFPAIFIFEAPVQVTVPPELIVKPVVVQLFEPEAPMVTVPALVPTLELPVTARL